MPKALDSARISEFVADWYRALDEHVETEKVLEYLVDEGLSMTFPEATLTTRDEFIGWYDGVVRRFFDEVHEVTLVRAEINGDVADVHVVVNWQARIWDPPAPTSQWLGFDADQTWQVVLDADGGLRIKAYVVNGLAPMPGSAQL